MSPDHNFLFACLDSKPPPTTRKVHIRRLYDVLELCIQRNDFARAKRAWAILVRCKEFRWEEHWTTGLYILNEDKTSTENIPQRIAFIRAMMLRDIDKASLFWYILFPSGSPAAQETMLKELVLLLILSGQYRQALDELELYLPSFPYQDNAILHIYAGLLCLHLAQGQHGLDFVTLISNELIKISDAQVLDSSLLRDAQSHLNQAKSIDTANVVVEAFLQKVCINIIQKRTDENETVGSENESMQIDDSTPRRKRFKISISPM
ncbi:RNA polymerase I-specific transcription initiation factor rrn11 [Leucoagaricus sp. SymC.cos]|nr:RNA polymerase I-specific transcription initiation factor rrn11 [Leucoagaricus sp. SymC.cos]